MIQKTTASLALLLVLASCDKQRDSSAPDSSGPESSHRTTRAAHWIASQTNPHVHGEAVSAVITAIGGQLDPIRDSLLEFADPKIRAEIERGIAEKNKSAEPDPAPEPEPAPEHSNEPVAEPSTGEKPQAESEQEMVPESEPEPESETESSE